ncbi:hypothetical protein SNL152K_6552 [Streptomyces sp. NL15-2K]|nr:hypothetical protein SNL152K_6552 [Streptomyces sp. NL15-2K]
MLACPMHALVLQGFDTCEIGPVVMVVVMFVSHGTLLLSSVAGIRCRCRRTADALADLWFMRSR